MSNVWDSLSTQGYVTLSRLIVSFPLVLLLLASQARADDQHSCTLKSIEPLSNLASQASNLGLRVRELSDAVLSADAQILSSIEESEILPFRVDASTKEFKTRDNTNGTNLRSSEDSVEMTADVAPWAIIARSDRFRVDGILKRKILQLEKAKHTKSVISEMIQIAKSISLENNLKDRKLIYEKQVDYFETLKVAGEKVSNELLKLNEKILDANDKLAALKVQQISSSLRINLQPNNVKSIGNSNAIYFFEKMNFICFPRDSIKYKIALLEKNYVQQLMKGEKYNQWPSVNIFNNYSRAKKKSTEVLTDNQTYGIKLSINLYNGGRDVYSIHESARKLEEIDRKIESELARSELNLTQWESTRRIYLASLVTLNTKLKSINEKIMELSEREKLGDSIFIELTDATLEASSVSENLISVQAELLTTAVSVLADFFDDLDLNYIQ